MAGRKKKTLHSYNFLSKNYTMQIVEMYCIEDILYINISLQKIALNNTVKMLKGLPGYLLSLSFLIAL